MTVHLNPYLHLDGQARAALEQYAAIFGGTPQVMTYGDMGTEGSNAELVMHGFLGTPDGLQLMVSDQTPEDRVDVGDGPRIALSGGVEEEARLREWFTGLAEGGEVHVPLERQPWGDLFGQCRDRYGVVWLVDIEQA